MTKPEALRLADKYEVEGFLQDHRFAQDHWCRQAAVELRRLHAANEALQAQLEAIGAGGVEPLRRDHFRGVTKMVPAGWAISYDGKTPHALWTAGEGDLLDLEVKRQGGTACKMELYAQVVKWKRTSK
jgi:hypothetical protein